GAHRLYPRESIAASLSDRPGPARILRSLGRGPAAHDSPPLGRTARARRSGRPQPRSDRPLQQRHVAAAGAGPGASQRTRRVGLRRTDRGHGSLGATTGVRSGPRAAPARQERDSGFARAGRRRAALRSRRRDTRGAAGLLGAARRIDLGRRPRRQASAGAGPGIAVRGCLSMTLSETFRTLGWLVRDTFRQSLAY